MGMLGSQEVHTPGSKGSRICAQNTRKGAHVCIEYAKCMREIMRNATKLRVKRTKLHCDRTRFTQKMPTLRSIRVAGAWLCV